MAFYTNKEFGELIGKKADFIRKAVSRGDLVRSGKLLDDNFAVNRAYLEKMKFKLGLAVKPVPVIVAPAVKVPAVKTPGPPPISEPVYTPPAIFTPAPVNATVSDSAFELEKRKAVLTIQKLEEEVRIKRSQAEKLEGSSIPTELVGSIISELSDSMKIAYAESVETYTVIVGAEVKLNTKQIAKIKTHFTSLINDTLKKQVLIAKKSLKNVVQEYSEVRGQGERKS